VYADRPRECRDFECLWLLGHFAEDDRPDALGVVICRDVEPSTDEETVCFAERVAGAADSPRVRELVAQTLAHGETVLVRSRERTRRIYPDGRTVEARVDPTDPMLVNVLPLPE
jgi:hypothetical protein